MTVTRLASALVAAAVLLLAAGSEARAATVVLVTSPHPSALAAEATVRLRGELAAEGFAVRVIEVPETQDPRAVLERVAAARDVDAVLAIFAESPADAIELWVIDRVTGKTVIRSVPGEPGSARSAEVLSIRALELLRASFLEIALGASRATPDEPAPPPPPVEIARMTQVALDARLPKTWAIEVGGCLLASFEGIPASGAPMLRVERAWADRWVARATLAGLGTRPRVTQAATKSSASVAQDFALLELGVKLRPNADLQPFFSLAAGVLHTGAEGQAQFPYGGKSGSLWTAVADAGVGVRLALRGRFETALELHAQVARNYPGIRFAGETLARGGRPTLIASLTLLVWL